MRPLQGWNLGPILLTLKGCNRGPCFPLCTKREAMGQPPFESCQRESNKGQRLGRAPNPWDHAKMNKRHKTILALSLAVAGVALLNGANISEAVGIILLGASLAWLIGSHFVLASAIFVWSRRIRFAIIVVFGVGAIYGWIRYDIYRAAKRGAVARSVDIDPQPPPTPPGFYDTPPSIPPPPAGATDMPPAMAAHTPTPKRVKALNDARLTTTEYGSLTCGHIRAGETAVLLIDDGGLNVKIKTADGQIGWASSSNFEVAGKVSRTARD